MIAALFSLGIFGFWLLLGFAVQPLFRCWRSSRKNLFLAPFFGKEGSQLTNSPALDYDSPPLCGEGQGVVRGCMVNN